MSTGRLGAGDTAIQPTILDAKGDLIVATAADTPARLAVGTNEQRLVADSSTATGLKYVADTTNYAIAAKGDLLVGTGADTLAALTVGTNGHTLVADSSTATGLKWAAPAASGSLRFISRTTFSNVASQAFTDVFTSTYGTYLVVAEKFHGANQADDIQLQFRYGSTTGTTNYYGFASYGTYSGTTTTGVNTNNAAQLFIAPETGTSQFVSSGNMYFSYVGTGSATYPLVWGDWIDAGSFDRTVFGGATQNSQNYTGFLLKSSSGNISGTVTIYGLATS